MRAALVALAALFLVGTASPAQASATAWYNDCRSSTYVTVEVYNGGYYYVNVNPCGRAGSTYVSALYYKLTAGWCSGDYPPGSATASHWHTGSNTAPWVAIPYNETTLVWRC